MKDTWETKILVILSGSHIFLNVNSDGSGDDDDDDDIQFTRKPLSRKIQ